MIGLAVFFSALVAAWVGAALALHLGGRGLRVGGRFDALVVAGAAVRADGRPSGALARRTEHAVALWRDGIAPRIVLTGGPSGSRPAEGGVAAAHARGLGVPEAALVIEDASTSTEENASGAARLLGPCRVVVITDSYHAFRCLRVFARHFPEVVVATTRPPTATALRLALREVVVILAYAASGRLGRGRSTAN